MAGHVEVVKVVEQDLGSGRDGSRPGLDVVEGLRVRKR
jgi:hypothetical protein